MSNVKITPYSTHVTARLPNDLVAEIKRIQEAEGVPLTIIMTGLLRHGLDAYKKAHAKH